MNNVNMVGRLTKDPELVERGKTKVCDLRLAVNGIGDVPPLFIDVATFSGQAEACAKYLVKGSLVAVSGPLRYSRWESNGAAARVSGGRSWSSAFASSCSLIRGGSEPARSWRRCGTRCWSASWR
ncbi:MAG: single-stranded DNA-binding protein [Solirubrobacterales bacterium]